MVQDNTFRTEAVRFFPGFGVNSEREKTDLVRSKESSTRDSSQIPTISVAFSPLRNQRGNHADGRSVP